MLAHGIGNGGADAEVGFSAERGEDREKVRFRKGNLPGDPHRFMAEFRLAGTREFYQQGRRHPGQSL